MALVLPAQPAFELHARMKVQSFKGDHDGLVDRLIAASQRREVAPETLKERALVPFFDSSESSAASFQALQPGRRSTDSKPVPVPLPHHALKRNLGDRSGANLAGSPPKKENEVVQGKHQRRSGGAKHASPTASFNTTTTSSGKHAAASSGSMSDSELTSARKPRGGSKPAAPSASASHTHSGHGKKHQRDTAKAASSSANTSSRQSPPRKRPEHAQLDMRQLAAASAAAGAVLRTPGKGAAAATKAAPIPGASKFAGPAFTNSPTPDCLPIPTSSLLLQEAADSLRSRLTL